MNQEKLIALGSDHGGWELKQAVKAELLAQGYQVLDYSQPTPEAVDYPQVGKKVAQAVSRGDLLRGILICGTGLGMSMVANKYPGVRAALCHDEHTARMSREHNNANILVLGGRVLSREFGLKIVQVWLQTSFAGERHARRVSQIEEIEKENLKTS